MCKNSQYNLFTWLLSLIDWIVPPIHMLKSEPLLLQNVTVFGNRSWRLNEVIRMGSNPPWLVSSKEEEIRTHTEKKDHVKTPEEDRELQARERAFEETNPADTLILDF